MPAGQAQRIPRVRRSVWSLFVRGGARLRRPVVVFDGVREQVRDVFREEISALDELQRRRRKLSHVLVAVAIPLLDGPPLIAGPLAVSTCARKRQVGSDFS